MKRKIFIVGHGFDLHTPTGLDFKTRFYVKSGKMLSDNVIPGIIQGLKYPELLDNCANWSDKDDAFAYEKDEAGNPPEHIIAITEDDTKSVLICGNYKPIAKAGKELPVNANVEEYKLIGTDNNRMFTAISREVLDIDRKQHLVIHRGQKITPDIDLSDYFLVYPAVLEGDSYFSQRSNPDNFIHLSDMINFFKDKYPNDTLRFFWLACRSEI